MTSGRLYSAVTKFCVTAAVAGPTGMTASLAPHTFRAALRQQGQSYGTYKARPFRP